ncbi:hypothetical protein P7C73_g3858, partial [Tremellales sp. Uapishka_1]
MKHLWRQSKKPKHTSLPAPPTDDPWSTTNPPTDVIAPTTQRDRFVPTQFAPNRIATLYITPSERNLYLAAMSQLDEAPPPLPLWTDAAPSLPSVQHQQPLEYQPPPTHHHVPGPSDSTRSSDVYPTSWPTSPKLVTSPELLLGNGSGLMVRDEFRRIPPRPAQHALLAFTLPATLRFTSFPAQALVSVLTILKVVWPLGILGTSESMAQLQTRQPGVSLVFQVDLAGKAWNRKGNQELDTIRMILAVMTALGVHGWTLVDNVQAASSKKDSHNLLFSYSAEVALNPPLYFAITLPLPDRVSIISPPPKSTPALLSAIRNAITAHSTSPHSRQGTAATADSSSPITRAQRRVTWNGSKSPLGQGLKDEGWVHKGVYRFWLAGMRRGLRGGIRRQKIETLHPQLLIAIVNSLAAQHFGLVGSLPLMPLTKGRDILIFSSLASSGLFYKDAFIPEADHPAGSLSPPAPSSPARPTHAADRRLLADESTQAPSSPPRPTAAAQPPKASSHPRAQSMDSQRPVPASARSSPAHRNVLLKKNSLRRHRSISGNTSMQHEGSIQSTTPMMTSKHDDHRWSLVDAPREVGPLGASVYGPSHTSTPNYAPDLHVVNPDRLSSARTTTMYRMDPELEQETEPRASEDTSEGHSVYLDTELGLGSPFPPDSVVPLSEGRVEKKREFVDVGSGIGINSMHGSVGYLGSTVSGHQGSDLGVGMDVPSAPPCEAGAGQGKREGSV